MAQEVECLPSNGKILSLNPSTTFKKKKEEIEKLKLKEGALVLRKLR
jgi:hypothetical protein